MSNRVYYQNMEKLTKLLANSDQFDPAQVREMVERMTLYDDAGYKNLRCFMKEIDRLAPGGLRHRAVIRFNLKHFSAINRELGREKADQVMKRYTQELEEAAGEDAIVCRLGADNFVMLCDQDYLGSVVSKLEGFPVRCNDSERVLISSTAGIFVIDDTYRYTGPDDLMDKAMGALNETRAEKRGDIVFYDNYLKAAREQLALVRKLFPAAIKNEEIRVYYQPKINVRNNTLIGAEALSRWFHNGDMILPGQFIPELEQSNDICKLDFYVLERVCRDISRWLKDGKKVVRISVNLSRRHLVDEDIQEQILDIIDMYNVPHKYLEIELTETSNEVEFKKLQAVVRGLQAAGVYTSVDDFGIGYSSLNMIREIPWNVIKVDRNFVPESPEEHETARSVMFRNVVHMIREMGRGCVVEGVETLEQVQVLLENGCDVAQGFFYDEPLPVEEFTKRLDSQTYGPVQPEK